MAVIACAVHDDSGPPQLMEITEGLCVVSCTAVVIASRKPASVLGAKYTTIFVCGAMAPTTSTSSMTSPSGPFASFVGLFAAWSTDTATTEGVATPRLLKYVSRSASRNPPPNSMRATHWPWPVPLGKP